MGLFFKKKATKATKKVTYATLQLNAKLQPMYRDEFFEKHLDKALKKTKIGSVDGGGTLMPEGGEIEYCDVNFDVYAGKEQDFIEFIKNGAKIIPTGSRVIIEDEAGTEFEIGQAEGLALYLNGTELPMEVYQTCNIDDALHELLECLGDSVYYYGHHRGNKETALYFYGISFDVMNERIAQFVSSYPLCQKCRIVRVA